MDIVLCVHVIPFEDVATIVPVPTATKRLFPYIIFSQNPAMAAVADQDIPSDEVDMVVFAEELCAIAT